MSDKEAEALRIKLLELRLESVDVRSLNQIIALYYGQLLTLPINVTFILDRF